SGDIPAVVVPEQTGFLYEQNNVSSLREAMQKAAESRILDHMRFMAGVFMDRVSAEIVTAQTEEIYAHLLGIGID
ncbi:MAG: hypothetical protein GTN65_14515, partial [Armatimonadetes bacterium]|nr:hypothetical protein [Armatimonadota bacterium]NIO98274.1 hypothetical protein [Armatimonadota bacterium]